MSSNTRRAFLAGVFTGVVLTAIAGGTAWNLVARASRAEMEEVRAEAQQLRQERDRLARNPLVAAVERLRRADPNSADLLRLQPADLLPQIRQNLDSLPGRGPVDNTRPILDQMHRDLHDPFYKKYKGDE